MIKFLRFDSDINTLVFHMDIDHIDNETDSITQFCHSLELNIINIEQGADRSQWHLDFEDCKLQLNYERNAMAFWLTSSDPYGHETLAFLAAQFKAQLHE